MPTNAVTAFLLFLIPSILVFCIALIRYELKRNQEHQDYMTWDD